MIDLHSRSLKKELLDQDNIPFRDIRQNMHELNKVNSLLGGHAITLQGVKQLIKNNNSTGQVTICEIGCGGGDNLKAISEWSDGKNISINFIGVDIKSECIAYAQMQYPGLNAKWIEDDYKNIQFAVKPDIIFSSLFCHHFNNDELIFMFSWMESNSKKGFFINDLQRNVIAYYSIKWLTQFFSRSYLVKNDAPLSVARGFYRSELKHLLQKSGIKNYTLIWKWAFRFLIVASK